ncbi:hypothetical protein A9974_27175 [Achromobacter sp. UMC71]|nr:hypothetical protein [Achromobacter sp. UMC71]
MKGGSKLGGKAGQLMDSGGGVGFTRQQQGRFFQHAAAGREVAARNSTLAARAGVSHPKAATL